MDKNQETQARLDVQSLAYTGKGTPGGELLRRYWQPIALSEDLETSDGAPVPVRVMGEDLVLFRDEAGRIGLVGRQCLHRCADLSYGRVEDGGLRCIYHGWLFDIEGKCVEKPGEPGYRPSDDALRHTAYPCRDVAGAIWAYMGPGEAPLFPNYPALQGPDKYRLTSRWPSNCNYQQANEGNIDPVHTSFLHRQDLSDASGLRLKSLMVYNVDISPAITIDDQRFGIRIFTERSSGADTKILRVTNFVMPNACAIGGSEQGLGRGGMTMIWHVPIDDFHHNRFEFSFHSKAIMPKEEKLRLMRNEFNDDGELKRNPGNRWLQDRESMKTGGSYLGMGTVFPVHDLFVTESQGTIHNRANEHLSATDLAVVRGRRQMLNGIRDIQAGKDPLGILRDEKDNEFSDMLVMTETLDKSVGNDAFCTEMTAQRIYSLNPDL